MKRALILVAMAALALQGCATKTYGRLGQLTDYEKQHYACPDIDLEIAKTQGWIDAVKKESEFSGADALALLIDFGIGNAIEYHSAIDSADDRLDALKQLRSAKGCGPSAGS